METNILLKFEDSSKLTKTVLQPARLSYLPQDVTVERKWKFKCTFVFQCQGYRSFLDFSFLILNMADDAVFCSRTFPHRAGPWLGRLC